MTRRLVAVSGGVGTPSSTRLLADRLVDAVRSQVGARGEDVRVDVIEVRELAAGLATTTTAGGLPVPSVTAAQDLVRAADGIIAVTPVFSGSYAGLFKMFWDTFGPDDLSGMPVLVAATAGTPRHSLVLDHALRPLFTYFRAVVVPTGVFAATEDFAAEGDGLGHRITRAAQELSALMVSTGTGVEGFTPAAPQRTHGVNLPAPGTVTPFARLLAGHDGG